MALCRAEVSGFTGTSTLPWYLAIRRLPGSRAHDELDRSSSRCSRARARWVRDGADRHTDEHD